MGYIPFSLLKATGCDRLHAHFTAESLIIGRYSTESSFTHLCIDYTIYHKCGTCFKVLRALATYMEIYNSIPAATAIIAVELHELRINVKYFDISFANFM